MSKGKWFRLNKLLSFNSVISMVMCYRSAGKTFASKEKIIQEFKKGKQVVWVRRFRTELEECMTDFWDVFIQKGLYQDLEFEVKGDKAYINGEVAVHFIALSTSLNLKGSEKPLVSYIFFDEYVMTKTGYNHYLKNEMKILLDLMVSVFRDRKKRLVLLSNTVSYVNPLFTFFNINPTGNEEFIQTANGMVTIQFYRNEIFKEETLQDDFYKMLEGTTYLDYAVLDKPLEDTSDFIISDAAILGNRVFICSFFFEEKEIAVWRNENYNYYFCNYKIEQNNKNRFFIDVKDNKECYKYLKTNRNSWRVKAVWKAFEEGKLYYINQETKKFMENIVRFL